MGNKQTNIPIDSHFKSKIVLKKTKVQIRVNVSPAATDSDGNEIKEIYLFFGDGTLLIDKKKFGGCITYEWTPSSHMRDFEVINPFHEEIKIARGQGIGVIIIEPLSAYVKLMYDKKSTNGIIPATYSKWDHSDQAKQILSDDLSLGYDVMLMTHKKIYEMCEKIDERDEAETTILFDEFKKYSNYPLPDSRAAWGEGVEESLISGDRYKNYSNKY